LLADQFNYNNALDGMFTTTGANGPQTYNPLTQDTPLLPGLVTPRDGVTR